MRRYRHKSRRKNKQRKIIIISMCSLLLIMTVGYATMQTNLEIKAKGNIVKKASAGSDLVEISGVVESGDGLYKDENEENVYTYRGAKPNNYVIFNDELWRIISVNTIDNTIKIIRNEILENSVYDIVGKRYQESSGYCNSISYGCNIWGSSNTLYNSSLRPITTLGMEYNGTKYVLPSKEAELNTYLNGEYYNGLNQVARSMVRSDAVYKAGILNYSSSQTTSTDINQVSKTKWKGTVALIDATEYVRASTNSSCTGVYAYYNTSSCYNNISNHNWMYLYGTYWWTMTPLSNSVSDYVWYVYNTGVLTYNGTTSSYSVRPVVTLSPEVKITGGNGSESNAYTLDI